MMCSSLPMVYADVVVPLALPRLLTYSVPASLTASLSVGTRVLVSVGKQKQYTAIIWRLHDTRPAEGVMLKAIIEVLDTQPILSENTIRFWTFLSQYYMCTLGEVMKAALPAGMKIASESMLLRHLTADESLLTGPTELAIWNVLQTSAAHSVAQIAKVVGKKSIYHVVRRMLEKQVLVLQESLHRRFKPKQEVRISLNPAYSSQQALHSALDLLHKSPRQRALFTTFLALAMPPEDLQQSLPTMLSVTRRQLLCADAHAGAALTALCKRGILVQSMHEVPRLGCTLTATQACSPLTQAQAVAFAAIQEAFHTHMTCLLHGVTSSGKTEIYMSLIQQVLSQGQQVLFLVPEIALTTQLTKRLGNVFGEKMGVYHSKFPDNERVEIWQKQQSDTPYQLLLGVRSSLFLPFSNLGLIIIDEEHDASYKQSDPAPRYHARDAAMVLANIYGAHVLLGTATPAIETYTHALNGKYALVKLQQRYGDVSLPRIEVVDTTLLHQQRRMRSSLSPQLITCLRDVVTKGGQAILFQNRRGYAPVLSCRNCGWVPRCQHCDVSLVYHQQAGRIVCHYCGTAFSIPTVCPNCEGTVLTPIGSGTEKIEEAVQALLPQARIARLDLDTTATRTAYEGIINDFQHGHTDILIGTQMVTKGLDFGNVRLVGILDADMSLSQPDFRSHERTFQMLTQVAGRAGRRQQRGHVLLQTQTPTLSLIGQICTHDYLGMYETQIQERETFMYPPFCRMIIIYLKHRDEATVSHAAQWLATYTKHAFGERVQGAQRPLIGRVQGWHIRQIILKLGPDVPLVAAKNSLIQAREALQANAIYKAVNVYFDVDPM